MIDTRKVGNGQPFSGTLSPPVDVVDSGCAVPSTAQGYVFNATVVPTGGLGYLTLWPDGEGKPVVSTLNATDGAITSNMAIVPNVNGKIDACCCWLDAVDLGHFQLLRAVVMNSPPTRLWRGFSGHWMAFCSAALAILYSAATTSSSGRRCTNGHSISANSSGLLHPVRAASHAHLSRCLSAHWNTQGFP